MKAFTIIELVVISIAAIIIYQNFFISNNLNNAINKVMPNQMQITSSFNNNGRIPKNFTCDGENISPELEITNLPAGAKSLAIICDDPDAPMGTWIHWVVFNIPIEGTSKKINGGQSPGTEGTTSFKKTGYGGPCPPSGTHRYFFKVYALDAVLSLKEGATKSQLESAMQGHVLEEAELVGLYSRK